MSCEHSHKEVIQIQYLLKKEVTTFKCLNCGKLITRRTKDIDKSKQLDLNTKEVY